jgi:protein-S-isoprenylcysteine O-methyltransferase Ste14
VSEISFFHGLLGVFVGLGALVFVALFFIDAPYGRHRRRGWGPTLDDTLGWVLMEGTSAITFAACFALGDRRTSPVAITFLVLWEAHYVHRAFIFPFRRSGAPRRMPVVVAGMAVVFNLMNAYLNGRWLDTLSPPYPTGWLTDPRFLAGAALFTAGFLVNLQSDEILRRLRAPGETGYKIPTGGLYRWVSSPNYLGEIIEWSGFALATWSLPGLSFALWTIANLAPRALAHHRWYREKFPDYPVGRRALIPYLL